MGASLLVEVGSRVGGTASTEAEDVAVYFFIALIESSSYL